MYTYTYTCIYIYIYTYIHTLYTYTHTVRKPSFHKRACPGSASLASRRSHSGRHDDYY